MERWLRELTIEFQDSCAFMQLSTMCHQILQYNPTIMTWFVLKSHVVQYEMRDLYKAQTIPLVLSMQILGREANFDIP